MNCEESRDQLAGYLEGLLDETFQSRVDSHLAQCPACRAEIDAVRELTARLARDGLAASAASLETVVMDRILREQTIQLRRLKMRRRIRVLGIGGATAAAIAVIFLGSLYFTGTAAAEKAAAETLAKGAAAAAKPTTVHVVAKMRTPPGIVNFDAIDAACDFVEVEVWKQFGDKSKWRVEKPGRVCVMDGASTTMLTRPDRVHQLPYPTEGAFDSGCLLELANVQDMITRELLAAQAQGWDLRLTHETTASGKKSIVTVEAKSGLPADDYLKNENAFFEDSDTRRVFRFDAKTLRLEGFDAYLHQAGGDVLVLSIERVEYDRPIDAAVFTLKLPDKVSLYREPERLPDNEKYEKMTPEQAARAFFEACQRKDWDEVKKFYWPCDDSDKGRLGSLELVKLGTPFQSEAYPGWFVPYEIRMTMKIQLQVCNDNPAKRYVIFGPGDKYDAKRLAELKPLPDQEKYAKMTPKEAVEAVCKAYVDKDADAAYRFWKAQTISIISRRKWKPSRCGSGVSGWGAGAGQ